MTDQHLKTVTINNKTTFSKVRRLIYSVIVLLSMVIAFLSHDKNEIAIIVADVGNALNLVDPFFLVNHLYLLHSGYVPPELQPLLGPPLTEAIREAGWLTVSFICVSTAILYYLSNPPNRNLLWSFIFSFLVAWPLKWLLIGLVAVLGAAVGFVTWIDGIVIVVIEAFLRIHHIYKAGDEVKEAASEIIKS
jgi:hypothetical protein